MFKRILIAFDGSKQSCKALDTGLRLAVSLGDPEVTVVTVVEPLPSYFNMAELVAPHLPQELREEHLRSSQRLKEHIDEIAAAKGLKVQTKLVEGAEVLAILGVAKQTHADLLVVGLRRHAPGVEWAGTVRRIANETSCSILAAV
jgi:nucleotide-binding universal stress UspA family protein